MPNHIVNNYSLKQKEERTEIAAFRLSQIEAETIKNKVSQTNIGKSEYLRRAALSIPIHSSTDYQMISELKRLGALMKHKYPKHSNWNDSEKREYWVLIEELNSLAKQLQDNIIKGK